MLFKATNIFWFHYYRTAQHHFHTGKTSQKIRAKGTLKNLSVLCKKEAQQRFQQKVKKLSDGLFCAKPETGRQSITHLIK